MADRREILTRYHGTLGSALFAGDVELYSARFRTNHRIGKDHPLGAELARLLDAHKARVAGSSSPADCDHVMREMVDA